MKRSLKVRLAIAAVAVGAVAVAAQPASADTGTATIAGTGAFAVGLGVSGPPQGFTFNGQGAVVANTVQSVMICALNGYDTIGSLAAGSGAFTGTCDMTTGRAFINGVFTRAGTFVTVNGIANGAVTGTFNGSCVFSPLPGVTTDPLVVVAAAGFAAGCQFVIT
jgi:hypothetical protein